MTFEREECGGEGVLYASLLTLHSSPFTHDHRQHRRPPQTGAAPAAACAVRLHRRRRAGRGHAARQPERLPPAGTASPRADRRLQARPVGHRSGPEARPAVDPLAHRAARHAVAERRDRSRAGCGQGRRRILLELHVDLDHRGRIEGHRPADLVSALRDARPWTIQGADRARQGRGMLGAGAHGGPRDAGSARPGRAQRPHHTAEPPAVEPDRFRSASRLGVAIPHRPPGDACQSCRGHRRKRRHVHHRRIRQLPVRSVDHLEGHRVGEVASGAARWRSKAFSTRRMPSSPRSMAWTQ